jgi:uncharacterized protein YndB with AHSA1/START domain
MTTRAKPLTLTLAKTIPAPPPEVYDAWLDPENPATIWHALKKRIFTPKVDGLFYLLHQIEGGRSMPHFGRFTILTRARKIQFTWMSPNTRGIESTVTITLTAKGAGTAVRLVHSNLPNDRGGQAHKDGWAFYLENIRACFQAKPR